MAVNLFGQAAPLTELRAIADKHGLFLIEDNAQAPAAMHHGRPTGTIGAAGIFSFNRHKTMQSGEGGVLVTDDDTLALKAALVRNHGEVLVGPMEIDDIVNTIGVNLPHDRDGGGGSRCASSASSTISMPHGSNSPIG